MYSEEQLKRLYDELSPAEKVGQLLQLNGSYYDTDGIMTGTALQWEFSKEDVQHAGSVLNIFGPERLRALQEEHLKYNKVPMIFMGDVISGYKIAYQTPLGQACSFDTDMVRRLSHCCAQAATAEGINVTFSPIADVARDARWGRCSESFGEDTYLCSCMTKAAVEGLQGENLADLDSLSACVKHFAAYGYGEGGRDYNNVEMSERTLRETFLPPYKAAIDAGCEIVMTSFNSIGGVPATIHQRLLRDILRGEWEFNGTIITDWCSMLGCIEHRAANSHKELACLGMEAGVDIAMMDYLYNKYVPELLEDGMLDSALFEEAVMRVLRLKNNKGLLEEPYRYLTGKKVDLNPQYEAAVEMVQKSCVLLKNEEQILPLSSKKRNALIGPYAVRNCMATWWSTLLEGGAQYRKMPKDALEEILGTNVVCEPGCAIIEYENFIAEKERNTDPCYKEPKLYLEKAIQAAKNADTVVMMLGEHVQQMGESRSRTEISLPEIQMQLLRKIQEVNPNIVTLVFSGRPLDLREVSKLSKAVMVCWCPGDAGSMGIATLLAGKAVPSAKLAMSFPYNVGQCPVHYDLYPTGHVQTNPQHVYSSRYIDAPNTPLYPFGYGLSYTTFEYSNVTASSEKLEAGKEITLSVKVTNTGDYDADEVVQLYLCDRWAKGVSRPYRELKGFKRISLKKNETTELVFEINEDMLCFYDADCNYISEPGDYIAYIGGDSRTDNAAEFRFVK